MKRLIFFVLAAFAFAACEQAPIEEQSVIRQEVPETLTVGFEGDDDTRIQLNEAQKTVWTKGDKVSVFYFSDANQLWQYNGETGSRTANLKRVNAGEPTAQTTYNVVAYPYNEDYFLNTRTGALHATLPATQHYLKDSYGVGDNLMVAQSEFTQFSLKSVCGWLKLQLTGDGEVVKSITFKGKNGEQVAGLIHVDTATAEATLASEMGSTEDNNAGGNLVFDDTILTEVTLDCATGVTLGAEATSFYIALPPQTFENGFKVEIVCADDTKMVKSSSNTLTIKRNHIQPMASVEYDASPIVPNNQIWYTSYDGNVVEPYNTNAFGANIISNTYNNGKGVITFDGDVTTIGYAAFYSCESLTSVNIPDSVTTIGHYAFYSCESLTSVNIPDSVTTIGYYAFKYCTILTSVNIPDSVTTIGESAFEGCDSLTSVTIPDSVTSIGRCAFYSCESLTSVNIPDSVTTIGEWAFAYCTSLTSVTIPDSVTSIGNYAFYYCTSLTSVNIGDSVTMIGDGAFGICGSLTEFTGKFAEDNGRILVVDGVLTAFAPAGITEYNIPDSVTTIGDYVFNGCRSLTSVTIPDSVTTIEYWAFTGCTSLIEFKGKFATEDGRSLIMDNTIIAYANASGTTYTIPDGVTSIGDSAFHGCHSLTSVTIPDSVTTIGEDAFAYCRSLTSVTIPDSVTTIGEDAFAYCSSLTSITIPNSVTAIGEFAFLDCSSLTSVYCKATTPPALGGTYVFYSNDSGRKIYVPTESVDAYKSATNWNEYASAIVGYDFEKDEIVEVQPNNQIWYTSYDGNVVEPNNTNVFGANITSNTYNNGKGVITLDGDVTTIGDRAFSSCRSLTSVTIPDSVTTIGDSAFDSCHSLTSVNIPDSVTTIGEFAFRNCISLTSVTIPDSVTSIGQYAFYYCTILTSVNIPDSVTMIGDGAFGSCGSLTEFTGKFAEDNGRILVVDGVLTAFAPAGITEYNIPDSVTSIGSSAFYVCRSLTSVTIPDSVTTIGDDAFYYCSSLTSVYCKATTPPSLGNTYVFDYNGSGRKIYVPAGSVNAYKSATNWNEYASAIVGYDFEN